ncbi:MAG: ankyrin repeat domain-containing protein [Candidatus Sulfotelmatobacter sp.]|jgi:ankyrin repeat protein
MGASFTNCHVRTSNKAGCVKALAALASKRALVTDPKKGWITVYDEESERQDIAEVQRMAKGLSEKLATDVLAFLLHDSDVFVFFAYREGTLVYRFNSSPDYFGPATAAQRKKWAGNFRKLRPQLPAGVSWERIERTLARKELFQEKTVAAFARLMGIDAARARTGFCHLDQAPHKLQVVHGRGHSPEAAELIKRAEKGDVEKVRALLSRGVSPNLKSRFGESLLASAIRSHKKEIAFALMDAGADFFAPPEANAIWAAAAHGEREVLARLLQSPSRQLQACLPRALASALQMGHAGIVADLLKAGADPNGSGKSGFTPLMSACFRGLEVVWESVFGREIPSGQGKNWTAIVKALLDAGADVNAQASNGVTALTMARATGQKEIVELLEKAGADPTRKPPAAEFEPWLETFREKAGQDSAPSLAERSANTTAANFPSKVHLDPKVRTAMLQILDRCKPKDSEKESTE